MDAQQQKILIYIALVALFIGGFIYLIDRPPGSIYLLPVREMPISWQINLLGSEDYLPSFFHVYSFILLTSVCLLSTNSQLIIICLFWFVIDSLFEIAQIEYIAQQIALSIGNQFDGFPILENIVPYFVNGIFDLADIYSITLGTLAAYITVLYIKNRHKGELA